VKIRLWFLPGLALLAGCQAGMIANPHDPATVSVVDAKVVLDAYNDARERLESRVNDKDLTPNEAQQLLRDYLHRQAVTIKPDRVPDEEAWRYADIFRLSGDWKTAEQLYARASGHAKAANDIDRWVNDTLRLAWTQAQLGKVEMAIATARTTFEAPPAGKAPLLYAVLYEIVPAGQDKGHDEALADLIVDAAAEHMKVQVNPQTDGGQQFLATRRYHLGRARTAALELYEKAGKQDKVSQTLTKFDELVRLERSI
jgi:hypothetical protein